MIKQILAMTLCLSFVNAASEENIFPQYDQVNDSVMLPEGVAMIKSLGLFVAYHLPLKNRRISLPEGRLFNQELFPNLWRTIWTLSGQNVTRKVLEERIVQEVSNDKCISDDEEKDLKEHISDFFFQNSPEVRKKVRERDRGFGMPHWEWPGEQYNRFDDDGNLISD